MKPVLKLIIAFVLTYIAISLPLFLPINDGSVFLIFFSAIFSMFFLRNTNLRKWYLIFGWLFCLLGLMSLMYVRFGELKLTFNFFLRNFLMYVFLFWSVGVIVGYVLTDGVKAKFNTGVKMGLLAMGLSLILPSIIMAWVKVYFVFYSIYFLMSCVNGYLSINQNVFKNFGYFMIPLLLSVVISLFIDTSVLTDSKLWLFLSAITGLVVLGTFIGFYFAKWKKSNIQNLEADEYEN